MGAAGMLGAVLLGETHGLLQNTALGLYQTFSQYDLIAVPLYIVVGTLMERAQLSDKLFAFARAWFGNFRGGLGVATIAACAMFAAISGSSVATAATIGVVALPALTRGGYRPEFSGAMVAAGGTLGILIPPSIPMIVFGVITEQSIGALFISGVVPGILLAAVFAVFVSLRSKVPPEFTSMPLRERLAVTRQAAGAVALPVLIFVSIYSGLATPTEVAAVAVAYVVILGVVDRHARLARHGGGLRRGSPYHGDDLPAGWLRKGVHRVLHADRSAAERRRATSSKPGLSSIRRHHAGDRGAA